MIKVRNRSYNCQIEYVFRLIAGKWKTDIIWELHKQSPLRFNELQRRLPGVTAKVLAKQLDELEDDQLVSRELFAEVPPRVEYRLSPAGESLWQHCVPLIPWADRHIESLHQTGAALRERALAGLG